MAGAALQHPHRLMGIFRLDWDSCYIRDFDERELAAEAPHYWQQKSFIRQKTFPCPLSHSQGKNHHSQLKQGIVR